MSSTSALPYNNSRNRNFLDEIDQSQIDRNENVNNTLLIGADDKRNRKAVFRRTIDYNSSVAQLIDQRLIKPIYSDRNVIQPDIHYQHLLTPPQDYKDNPMNCVCAKHVRTSTNKNKCPIHSLCWTPDGRRLITGASSGEFTLWNGLTFNFETILQAHDSPIKAMKWSHNEEWLLSGDNLGMVKYWQANMNDVNVFQAHKDAIRGLSFCPSDQKFVTCSVDNTVRIWDFEKYREERVLRGHGGEVNCVAWHPTKSLVLSGAKDCQQPIKLWDPKSGDVISTLYAHKSAVNDVSINKNGNWFLTASKDHTVKLFDLRNLSEEMQVFRGHKKDVFRAQWHPVHEGLFVSGSGDGALMYWLVGSDMEVGSVDDAHDNIISSLDWHPMGHILATGSNDFSTKFWTRNRPGDVLKDNVQVDESRPAVARHTTIPASTAAAAVASTTEAELEAIIRRAKEEKLSQMDLGGLSSSIEADLAGTACIPGLSGGAGDSLRDIDVHSDTEDEDSRHRYDDSDSEGHPRGTASRTLHKQFALNWAEKKPVFLPIPEPPVPVVAPVIAPVAVAPQPLVTNEPVIVPLMSALTPQNLLRQQQQFQNNANFPMDVVANQARFAPSNAGFVGGESGGRGGPRNMIGRNFPCEQPQVPFMNQRQPQMQMQPPQMQMQPPHLRGNPQTNNYNQGPPPRRDDGFETPNQRGPFYPQQNMMRPPRPPMHDFNIEGNNRGNFEPHNRRPPPPPQSQRNFVPNNGSHSENPFEPQKATGSSQGFIPIPFGNNDEPPCKRGRWPGNKQGPRW